MEQRTYLTLKCPAKECSEELILTCPNCGEGALSTQKSSGVLSCDHCPEVLSGINCHCGYTLSASYIQEKERRLSALQRDADPSSYFAILKGVALVTVLAWLTVTLLG